MNLQLLDIDYQVQENEVKTRIFAKTKNGETVICIDGEFLPYFYAIPEEETSVTETKEEILETEFESDRGKKLNLEKLEITEKEVKGSKKEVLKVYTAIPAEVPKLKNELWDFPGIRKCMEFDIPFYRRYLIDKGLRPEETFRPKIKEETKSEDFAKRVIIEDVNPLNNKEKDVFKYSIMSFDIEVYQSQVIMISFYSNSFEKLITTENIEKEYSEQCETEEELLTRFKEIINERDPDIITGYNTDEYDFTQLRERFQHHNIEMKIGRNGERMKFNRRGRFKGARIKGRPHLDLYPFITHILSPRLESERLDLDSVSKELLDKEKDDMSWEEMKESWKNKENLEKFAKYALKDSQLTYELSEEIVPQIRELARITGLTHFDACRLTYGQLTENFLIREAHRRNKIAKNRPSMDSRRDRQRQSAYSGGFVYEPEAGLYEDIVTLDFRSLYPTVIVSHNISPDTFEQENCKNEYHIEELDYSFCQDEQGFFPELVEELVKDRYQIKDQMKQLDKDNKEYQGLENEQSAKKVLANSVGPDAHLVLENPEGEILVQSIEDFYSSLGAEEKYVEESSVKEIEGWKALSLQGDEAVFKPIYAASCHEPNDAFKIKTKMGEVTITGDHSLIEMEGKPSNRVRDSEFDGLNEIKGSKVTKDSVIAQINDLELNQSVQEVIVAEELKNYSDNFYLYIPKSENLEKRDWYKRRVELIREIEKGKNSRQIRENENFGNKALAKARKEGLINKTATVGPRGNTYQCEITEKGEKYKEFYSVFQKREKNAKHYLIPLDELDEMPPREILKKSKVANKDGRARNKIPAIIELEKNFASLLGWFVAEGHYRKVNKKGSNCTDSAIASDDPQQRKEIQKLFKKVFDYEASVNGRQVSCCTSTMAKLLAKLCGEKAETKKVPRQIFNSPKPVRNAFLEAYSLGDGDEDGRRFSTISKKLQAGLSLLLKEQDKILHNGFDIGTYRISKRTKTLGEKIVSGDLYGQKPKKIEKTKKPDKVYDLSIKDTEKFATAEGIVLHNSFYGYLGYEGARWYSRESAEATTYLGRKYIEETIEKAEKNNYEVVYGDTDSVFLQKQDGNIKETINDFLDKVNKELPEFMELEYEGYFKRGFFTSTESGEGAKKKYALIDEEDQLKIAGFEQVRRDWSPIAKETQKQVLKKVLQGDVEGAAELVKETIEKLKNGEVPVEKLKIYTTLTKPPEEYDSTAPHVEAAKKARKRGDTIEPETTIDYVITNTGASISDKAELTKYADSYDSQYYIENQIIPVTLRVLKVFGYTEGQLKGKGKQSGLGQFS